MKKIAALISLLLLFSACSSGGARLVKQYGGEKTHPDRVQRREVHLSNPHNGEKADVVYFHDGSYDAKAMKAIDHLFRDRQTGEIYPIDPELIDYMVDIRARLMLPQTVTFEILSGYRSPETNAKLRLTNGQVAKESFHIRGWAVDFRIPAVNGKAIAEIAKTMQRGGVSFYPRSNHVHVDLGNIRTWSAK